VSEEGDEDRRSHLAGPSSRGIYAGPSHRAPQVHLSRSSTPHLYQYNNNPPPTLFHPHRSEFEGRHYPAVPYPTGYPDARQRRQSYSSTHSSTNTDPRTYAPEHTSKYPHSLGPPQYVNEAYPGHRPPSAMRERGYSSGYPPRPQEIYTNIPSIRGGDDEQTPVARHHSSDSRSIPYSQMTPEDAAGSGPMKYECSYCGKGFNRPSSLKVGLYSPLSSNFFLT
jgi:hypothetical protein